MLPVLVAMTLLTQAPVAVEARIEAQTDSQGIRLFPKRIQSQILSLQTPIALERGLPDTSVKDVLEFIQDLASPAEAQKEPSKRVVLLIDHPAFREAKGDGAYRVDEEKITVPRMASTTLETVLQLINDQIGGAYLVERDHILITTKEKAYGRLLKPNEKNVLIHWAAEKQTLESILSAMSDHYGYSIVISAQTEEKGKQPLTVKFLNVPLEDAVETLAESSGLKVVKKANLLFLTLPDPTPTRPKEPVKVPTPEPKIIGR